MQHCYTAGIAVLCFRKAPLCQHNFYPHTPHPYPHPAILQVINGLSVLGEGVRVKSQKNKIYIILVHPGYGVIIFIIGRNLLANVLDKYIKNPQCRFSSLRLFVQCQMCPIESKLSVVHICHYTGEPRKCLPEKRHRAINIKNKENHLQPVEQHNTKIC